MAIHLLVRSVQQDRWLSIRSRISTGDHDLPKECGNATVRQSFLPRESHFQCGHELMGCLFGEGSFPFLLLYSMAIGEGEGWLQVVGRGLLQTKGVQL
jgi:hypothetical protein